MVAPGEPGPAAAAAWWGNILASAREHATTAEVWDAIRSASAETGLAIPSDMFQQVNHMRSLAVGLREASANLSMAANSDAITAEHLAQTIYSRSAAEQALAPTFHVRFQMSTMSDQGPIDGWYTLSYSGGLPGTVGDLRADVEEVGMDLADSYSSEFIGTGAIEVSVI